MSILIKGIKVHRGDCWGCPCLDGEYGDCNVLEKDVHYIAKEDCPLIELPDHGDLIDRDELWHKMVQTDNFQEAQNALWSAPVVIPAERSEE